MAEITLKKPLELPNGDTLSTVTLREPTVDDVVKHGLPVEMGYDGHMVVMKVNAKTVMAYVATLSGLPPSNFKQLGMADFAVLSGVVQGFFPTENPETNSS